MLDRLIYIAKGSISFHCDGQCHTAVAGQCIYLPQGLTIDSSFNGESNWTYSFIFRRIQGTLWDGIRVFSEDPIVIATMHQCTKNEKITKYARLVYMSESQFRKHMGVTPVEYRNQIRLKQVENLLFSGYTLEEATQEVGFNSVSYYCGIAKKTKEKDVL